MSGRSDPVSDPVTGPGGASRADDVAAGTAWEPEGTDLARALVARARANGRGPGAGATARLSPRSGPRRRGPPRDGPGWSGSAGDERDPQPLDTVIGRLVDEHGWGEDLAVHGVIARWDLVVGPAVAAHVHPERYARGRLTVRAESTAWATQVRLLAPTLLRRINEEIGDGTVSRIDVLGPHAPSWRKGPRTVRGPGPRDTYG